MKEKTHEQLVIWVIDDDETALMLAEDILSNAGFQVETFSDAAAALATAAGQLPDLVIVDVIMPGMDGFEFCGRFRELPRADMVPVLVTTSLDDTESINRAYEAGATNFTSKPVNWTIEVKRLHYLLKSANLAVELKKKEQETRLAKEDWEGTFESIADSVTVLDLKLNILRANRATFRIFGGAVPAIVGRPCHEVFCHSHEACPDCPVWKVLASGMPASVEMAFGPSGRLYEISVSPVTDRLGKITRLVHVARDLSEKKKLEAELRHAQKMEAIGTLAGGIAHDFNNLLTTVQCCADLSIADNIEAGRTDENLEAIQDATRRGAALTRQLLLFSRKARDTGQKQVLDLNDVLRGMRKVLEKGFSPSVAKVYRLAPELRFVRADAGQLEQVVMNLAVNAAHAMPDGGSITIETGNLTLGGQSGRTHPNLDPGDSVLLTVADTGHGMSKETLARIYEPFFTTKKVGEGTGLGLSVVFGIVKEHDGHIECQSETGVGTTFRIYLPAVGQGEKQAELTLAVSRNRAPGGTETILVVDDEAPLRRLLERHLGKLGYDVICASDGEMGWRKYSEASPRPHAVILDLGMPKASGWECLAKLREIDPGVKVLIASGYGGDDLEERATKSGAAAFLSKPYNLDVISRKLRDVMLPPGDARAPAQGHG
jgi:PAS domain S-box-containing protein